MSLRPMRWQDIPTLAVLEPELFGADAWSERTWWAELAMRPRREYVVATGPAVPGHTTGMEGNAGNRSTGPAGAYGSTGPDGAYGSNGPGSIAGYAGIDCGGDVADVMTIAVAPGWQGHGVGVALMAHLVDRARHVGAGHLMLEVRADNLPAQRLYSRTGFELLTVRRRYYQPGDVDAHIMRLDLTPPNAHETVVGLPVPGVDSDGLVRSGDREEDR